MDLRKELLKIPELQANEQINNVMDEMLDVFKSDEFFSPFVKELDIKKDSKSLIDRIIAVVSTYPSQDVSAQVDAIVKEKMNAAIDAGMIRKSKTVDFVKLIG